MRHYYLSQEGRTNLNICGWDMRGELIATSDSKLLGNHVNVEGG